MSAVLLDAYNIALAQGTGVATYGRNLASVAGSLGHDVDVLFGARGGYSKTPLLNEIMLVEGDPKIRRRWLVDLMPGKLAQTVAGLLGSRRARKVPLSGEVIMPTGLQIAGAEFWNASLLYRQATGAFNTTGLLTTVRGPSADVAHWTYPLPVRLKGAANIYTLHDLVPLRLPHTTADEKKQYYKLCRKIVDKADHIITVSECSRRDIIRIFGIEESRISNLYQSSDIDTQIAGIDRDQTVREVEGLLGTGDRGYYLFFGAVEPKKNLSRLIEAYLASRSPFPLVIVGAPGWGSEADSKLLKQMVQLDHKNRIRWLGFLPRSMLASVISCARATIFPSLYEGFGLPVLESMALGTPVITSNVSSLPEVAGDAALLVDPYDTRSITRAIRTMDQDDGLRQDLSIRGRTQAAQFSPEAYRDRLQGFYKRVCGLGSPTVGLHGLAADEQKAIST